MKLGKEMHSCFRFHLSHIPSCRISLTASSDPRVSIPIPGTTRYRRAILNEETTLQTPNNLRDDSGRWAGVRDDSAKSHLMSPQLG